MGEKILFRLDGQSCATCHYHYEASCRYDAPTRKRAMPEDQAVWPYVNPLMDWCGKYRTAEGMYDDLVRMQEIAKKQREEDQS